MVANAMISDMDRTMRSGRRSPVASSSTIVNESPEEAKMPDPPQEPPLVKPTTPPAKEPSQPILSFGELLSAQAKYSNETNGFKAFSDIWSYEKKEVISVEKNNELSESNPLLSKFKRLQGLRQRNQGIAKTNVAEEAAHCSSHSSDESSHSGTSTMALHDANESDDTQSAVSKEITPPPGLTTDFSMATQELQLTEKDTETETETETGLQRYDEAKAQCLEATTSQKSQILVDNSSKPDANLRLIQECLSRRVEVRLDKLTPTDIEKLRRLRVLVKRTNFGDYYREQTVKRNRSSSSGRRSHTQTEDSSGSTNTFEPIGTAKKFVHITSDTPAPAMRVVTAKPRFKQFKRFKQATSDSSTSTDLDETARSDSARRRRGSKLVPKPKKTKHKFHKRRHVTADVIELSSDSISSTPSPAPVAQNRFPEVAMPLELDPLYEEEVVPFFR